MIKLSSAYPEEPKFGAGDGDAKQRHVVYDISMEMVGMHSLTMAGAVEKRRYNSLIASTALHERVRLPTAGG